MSYQMPDQGEKYDYVQGKFTAIAQRYDLFNDLITQGFHRHWKNQMIKLAMLQSGDRALDICCGTGDITERLKRAVGSEGQTVGLDFSYGMLEVARSRKTLEQTPLIQGDATQLPFQDASFDAVTVGYGLRNLVDLEGGLKEVLRVLKPGGRFISLDLGKVTLPVAKQVFGFYFFKVVPQIGKILYPGEDMFDYFPQSSVAYPAPEKLQEMMEGIGFEGVSFQNYHFGGSVIHQAFKAK